MDDEAEQWKSEARNIYEYHKKVTRNPVNVSSQAEDVQTRTNSPSSQPKQELNMHGVFGQLVSTLITNQQILEEIQMKCIQKLHYHFG
jgi:hypothetical protein